MLLFGDKVWFSLFLINNTVFAKQAMASPLLRYERRDVAYLNKLLLPVINESTQLKDLVRENS